MKNMIIENKQLRKSMDKGGLEHFALCKNKDYFWVVATDNASEIEKRIAVDADSIGVYAFNRQSIDHWIKDIKNVLLESYNRNFN